MPDSRDVFRLRKQGQPQEALAMARQIYALIPNDPWTIKAYGWSLFDCLKIARDNNDITQLRNLFQEFSGVEIPNGEEALLGARESCRDWIPTENGGPAVADLLQQAKQESDLGNRTEALRLYREGFRRFPNSKRACIGLGWEIQRALKDVVSLEDIDGQVARNLLLEYRRLTHIEKPSNLHSMILFRAAQAAEKGKFSSFISFLQWWNPENFRSEDSKRFTPEGADKSFNSLMEHVIRAVQKSAKVEQNKEHIKWAAEFVGQHFESFPEQEWFPYYYGQLLVMAGDLDNARPLILPIVRRKRGESWAWDLLAATFKTEQKDVQLACLCKALQCRSQNEDFSVKIHEKLAQLLVELNFFPEAKFEVEKAIQIRESNDWTFPQILTDLRSAHWFRNNVATTNNDDFYQRHSPLAEKTIIDGLPFYHAVVIRQIPPSPERPGKSIIAFLVADQVNEIAVKTKQFDSLKTAEVGLPISIRIDDDGQKPYVVTIEPRIAKPWDIILAKAKPVWNVEETFKPDGSIFASFDGFLKRNSGNSFGFVSNIFVPGELLSQAEVADSDSVKGLAMLSWDKRKERYGWRAIVVERA